MISRQIDQEIRSITNQIVRKYKPQKIILFGSAARGDYGPDSDLDILIIKDGLEKIKRQERYYQIFKFLETKEAVDVLVYTPYEIYKRQYLEDPFIKSILKEGKVLYGS